MTKQHNIRQIKLNVMHPKRKEQDRLFPAVVLPDPPLHSSVQFVQISAAHVSQLWPIIYKLNYKLIESWKAIAFSSHFSWLYFGFSAVFSQ